MKPSTKEAIQKAFAQHRAPVPIKFDPDVAAQAVRLFHQARQQTYASGFTFKDCIILLWSDNGGGQTDREMAWNVTEWYLEDADDEELEEYRLKFDVLGSEKENVVRAQLHQLLAPAVHAIILEEYLGNADCYDPGITQDLVDS